MARDGHMEHAKTIGSMCHIQGMAYPTASGTRMTIASRIKATSSAMLIACCPMLKKPNRRLQATRKKPRAPEPGRSAASTRHPGFPRHALDPAAALSVLRSLSRVTRFDPHHCARSPSAAAGVLGKAGLRFRGFHTRRINVTPAGMPISSIVTS